ncbi:PAAR domain-containing protein [Frankia gtarii]|uniref:PAAR domain-containing protein n=1 Tax=Frankia gtarii TaxID=2950102 RepID=UPI0021C1F6A2|nr:PAAR domain-containing protein [Frankia gtarii]
MGQPAAKDGDQVVGTDTHIVLVPSGPALVPTPLPHPFTGRLSGGLAASVLVEGKAVAVVGSTADHTSGHVPTPPGTSFQRPPANRGAVRSGSATVLVEGKGLARAGDPVATCNDPADAPVSSIVAAGTVLVGG